MSDKLKRLWARFASRKYRDGFVTSHLSTTVAAQIAQMREDRGWTQQELADKAGMKQSRFPVLEDPSNQSLSMTTIRRIARAFDVAVIVRFVPFSEIARFATDARDDKFSVRSFEDDQIAAPMHVTASRAGVSVDWLAGDEGTAVSLEVVLSPETFLVTPTHSVIQ